MITFKILTASWEPLKFQEKQLFLRQPARILIKWKDARVVFVKGYTSEIWIYGLKHEKAHTLNVDTGEIGMITVPKTKGIILTFKIY